MQGNNSGQIAAEVSKNLVGAESPLDFIKNNIKTTTPQQSVAQVAAQTIVEGDAKTVVIEAPKPEAPKVEEPKVVETPPEPTVEAKPDVHDLLDQVVNKKTKDDSIKDLRKKAQEAERLAKEREEEAERLKQEVEKYKTGEALPEVVEQYKSKAQELEKYRDLYDLESSPEYIKTYIEPAQQAKEGLHSILKEYNVPVDVFEQVVSTGNERTINKFLSEHFDPIAGTEIKGVINGIRNLSAEAARAKESPKAAITDLLNNSRAAEAARRQEQTVNIESAAKTGWSKAITKMQQSGKYPELVLTGDPKTDAYVKPIIENAAKEFGTVVNWMTANGLTDLPEEISEILATRFALSEASGLMALSRQQMYEEYTLAKDKQKLSRYESPPIGGNFSRGMGASPQEQRGPNSPYEAGEAILNKLGLSSK
jgi:hypothetical protein